MAFENAPYGDIRATLAVSQDEAKSGSRRVVNLPNGQAVTVMVPAGIQDGAEIRVPGQGEVRGPSARAGDLILRIAVIATPRLEAQPWVDTAMPTVGMAQSALFSATQAPTEYAGYVPPEAYQSVFPSDVPRERVQLSSGMPQASTGYGAPTQQRMYIPLEKAFTPQPPRRQHSGLVIFLVVLIVFVLLLGGGSLYYLGYYQPNQLQSAASATAQVQATSTAQVVQATARVAATSTAQAQATVQAYQTLYTQVTSGTPALDDSMSSQSNSRWEEFISPTNGTCGFSGGAYHAVMPKATFFQPCFALTPTFGNFAFQVDMTIVQGDEGGIIFRANEQNDTFYLLKMNNSGAYYLYLYVSNQASQAQTLLSGQSNLMLPVGQTNEITLVAQGSQLTFYLNKHYLSSVTDITYNTGMIGVFSESQNQPTDAAFSNVKVWTL